jgi:hypothetical protein
LTIATLDMGGSAKFNAPLGARERMASPLVFIEVFLALALAVLVFINGDAAAEIHIVNRASARSRKAHRQREMPWRSAGSMRARTFPQSYLFRVDGETDVKSMSP